MRRDLPRSAFRMMGFNAEQNAAERALHLIGCQGPNLHVKLVNRAFNGQPVAVHRLDMGGVLIDKDNVLSGADKIGTNCPPNGTCSPNDNGVACARHAHGPSIKARVSSTAICHSASISSSLF